MARVYDLTALSRPGNTGMNVFGAALFDSGRPVLMAPPTPPNTIVVTTGTADATLRDAGNVPGPDVTSGPFTGAAGPNCTQLAAGNLTGLVLVGSFPGADTVGSPLGDDEEGAEVYGVAKDTEGVFWVAEVFRD
jgi:hypothetical protein